MLVVIHMYSMTILKTTLCAIHSAFHVFSMFFPLLPSARSMFYFVESWWFHLLAASVICSNTVSIVLEADSTSEERGLFRQGQDGTMRRGFFDALAGTTHETAFDSCFNIPKKTRKVFGVQD